MAYANLTDARDDTKRDEDLLDLAADIVQHIAPAGDDPAPDYADKAARAERLVWRYLDATDGGVVASKNLTGAGAQSYASDPVIMRLVSRAMQPPDDTGGGQVRRGRIV